MAQPEMDKAQMAQLQSFVAEEQQKQAWTQAVHNITSVCWDKCISKVGNKLDSSDATCVSNCAERFMDANVFLMRRMLSKSKEGGQ